LFQGKFYNSFYLPLQFQPWNKRDMVHTQVVRPVLIQRNVGTIYFMFGVRFRGLPIGSEDGLRSTSVNFFIK
jgi:hypothetical protein